MAVINYAHSLIVQGKNIIGAHVATLIIPDSGIRSSRDLTLNTYDVYDVNRLNYVENIRIKNGKITVIHGSSNNYNKIEINAFGHLIPLQNNGHAILGKLGNNYICIDIADRLHILTLDQILIAENRGTKFFNVAIDNVRKTIRPLASAGETHNIREFKINTDNKLDSTINHKIKHWVTSPSRVVLFDIDGTITDSAGKVPPEMINRLIKLNSIANLYVILATGRILEHELSKQIHSDIVALGNGSLMFRGNRLVAKKVLDKNIALTVTEYARLNKLACQTYDPENRLIIQRRNSYQHDDPEAKNMNNKVVYVDKHTELECSITPKVLIAVRPDMVNRTKSEVEQIVDTESCNVMITTKTTVEVVPKGVDKQLALNQICRILGITPNEVITVGDNNNDIPMLANSGLSFAVRNASTDVRRVVSKTLTRDMWEGSAYLVDTLIKAHKIYYKQRELVG